ncbi:MAG: CDP-2,3-bis-(O-geranylgeranyl)-sn-glycerol synthase [Candidatus Micrarchaeia archaeon]|jgi:CDP-2,3-bis-(O-geranylgeranyl)-sn-glycerol synthase
MSFKIQSIQAFFQLLLFIFPAYVANSSPVIFGGGAALDGGRKFFDGKRLFGEGKTFRGFVLGLLSGTVVGAALAYSFDVYGLALGEKLALAVLLSLGTVIGDVFGSFVKRRQGLSRGESSFGVDQLSFLAFALAFAFAYRPALLEQIGLDGIAILVVITFLLHKFFNIVAHFFKLKKVPW